MSENKKKKKKSAFRKFLGIHAGVLGVAAVVVCIIVWNKLSDYQKSYDLSEKAHAPEKFAEEFTDSLNYDSLLSYMNKFGINIKSGIEPEKNLAEYYSDMIGKSGAAFSQNEKYSDSMPVYDIYSGEERIAVISLGADGVNDSFGFHDWKVLDMAFDTDRVSLGSADVIVPTGAIVTYNGTPVTDDFLKESGISREPQSDRLLALGINTVICDVYHIDSTFGNTDIEATGADGSELASNEEDGTYDFSGLTGEEPPEDIEERIVNVMESFSMTMNRLMSFDDMSRYLEYGSDAYNTMKDVMASVLWGTKIDSLEFSDHKVSDYVRYTDDIFACSYEGLIYKIKDGEQAGRESFTYRLIFRRTNGQWYLNSFCLIG